MMKLKSVFKFGDLDNQEEVYNGGVISILLAIGRHLCFNNIGYAQP